MPLEAKRLTHEPASSKYFPPHFVETQRRIRQRRPIGGLRTSSGVVRMLCVLGSCVELHRGQKAIDISARSERAEELRRSVHKATQDAPFPILFVLEVQAASVAAVQHQRLPCTVCTKPLCGYRIIGHAGTPQMILNHLGVSRPEVAAQVHQAVKHRVVLFPLGVHVGPVVFLYADLPPAVEQADAFPVTHPVLAV